MSEQELLSSIAGKKVAQQLLDEYGSLPNLSQASFSDLAKEIGRSKALAVRAAFALSNKLQQSEHQQQEKETINTPTKALEALRRRMPGFDGEEFWSICLDPQQKYLISFPIFTLDKETVIAEVQGAQCATWILVHSHLHGDLAPSNFDIATTTVLVEQSQRSGIFLLDHIITGGDKSEKYYSLRQTGYLRHQWPAVIPYFAMES